MRQARSTTVLVVTRVQKRFHMRSLEWFLILPTTAFAAVLFAAPDMFVSLRYYEELLRLASQPWWAVGLLLAGLGRLIALLVNGSWRFSAHARVVISAYNAIAWMLLTFGFSHIGRWSFGSAICPCLLAAELYSVWRAASEAASADMRARSTPALA